MQSISATPLRLGGLQLSDKNGTVLTGDFFSPPTEAGSRRSASFQGDERLFVGIFPTSGAETPTVLLEVAEGNVSYRTVPGEITISGSFFADQPKHLSIGQRFIYRGSLTLPIKKPDEEDLAKGYEVASTAAASAYSNNNALAMEPYLEPKILTLRSKGIDNPSLTVKGEFVPKYEDERFGFIKTLLGTDDYTVTYNETKKTVESIPKLNYNREFQIPTFFLTTSWYLMMPKRSSALMTILNLRFALNTRDRKSVV